MSRIGRQTIAVPAGVTAGYEGNNYVVKGPLGTLEQYIDSKIKVSNENGIISLTRENDDKDTRAKHGLYKALIANMVTGVTKGFEKALIVNGVGYKAQKQGNKIIFNVGFSHPVEYLIPADVTVDCVTLNEVVVKGINKDTVGQSASNIRAIKIPDPYHLYGIRYKNEIIQKKEGKTAGK